MPVSVRAKTGTQKRRGLETPPYNNPIRPYNKPIRGGGEQATATGRTQDAATAAGSFFLPILE